MPGFLKQSTAAQSRAIGPFIDDTDFKSPATGLTIANTDIKLVVNGGASANKNSGGGTHRVNGVYGVTFDATDTATVGEMEVSVNVAGALVVFDKFIVVEEAVYDMLFAASALGYIANAPVQLADGVAHGGTLGSSTATLALSRMSVVSQTVNQAALTLQGNGTREGLRALGGATGEGIGVVGGGTSGDGIRVTTTDGHGLNLAPAGNSKHGLFATGGNTGTCDGIKAAAGNAGVDIRGAITGNVTGNLSGSVGSVTARVTANTDQLAGQTVTAGAGVTFPTSVASPTNITAGTITTVTNLTNAPTNGDFTSTMKTSIGTAVAASAVASVTGNVGGNVAGSVGSVVGLTASNLDATVSSRLASASYTAPLDAAGTRSAVGLASANLDTQLAALPTDSDVQTAAAAAITAAEPIDADIKKINGTTVNGDGGSTPWGP